MKIYVVPTQHHDPYWTLPPKVAEKIGVRNLRKALDIIKENSEFKYVIGQVWLWELFKKYFPERVKEFKQRVKEGKIILTCGGYVNPDFNLPSGESLIRQLSFGKRVWQEEFGVDPEIAWIQDSFGNPASLPQIFLKLRLKLHTAKRGAKKDLPAVFIWEGADGSQIFFDRQPLGHHGIVFMPSFVSPAFSVIPNKIKPWEKLEKIMAHPWNPLFYLLALIALYLPDFNLLVATKGSFWRFKSALKHLAKFYPDGKVFIPHGFGFDSAMPFGYITKLCKLYSRLSKDKMFIVSPSDFLRDLERDRENLLVIKGELNGPNREYGEAYGALPGTYSTRIDVKQRARKMERLLYLAELLETLKYLNGRDYRDFTEIWKLKFLTDFHDGICGSLTDDNYQLLKQKGESVIRQCQRIIKNNLKALSPRKSIFNPLPWQRKDIARINGELKLVEAAATGFSPIEIFESEEKFEVNREEKVLITPFYTVSWRNGLGISKNRRLITGKRFARFRLQQEQGDSYFWDVSQDPKDWKWDKIQSIELIECGKVRAVLQIKSRFPGIKITQKIIFYFHTPRVVFETEIRNRRKNTRLQAHFPFNLGVGKSEIVREIPAGFLKEGESPGQSKWKDVFGERFAYYDNIKCAQNWFYLGSDKEGVAVFNDGLPEYEIIRNHSSTDSPQGCFLTLLRCVAKLGTEGKGFLKKMRPANVPWRAGGPHPIPLAQEQGTHKFRYAFYPGERKDVVKECYEFLFPLLFCQGNNPDPKPAEILTLLSISDKGVTPFAVKKAERGNGVVIRFQETEGKEKDVELKLNPNLQFKSAKLTDLMEEDISDLSLENGKINFRIKPQEIVTVILEI